jgi:hypothetical protein
MTDIFKIPKENGLSHYDGQNVLRDVHNESNKALDSITVNQLVPARFSRVELEYFEEGPFAGEVSNAKYYSDGAKEQVFLTCLADVIGSPHKTSILYTGNTSTSIAKTYLVIHDNTGSVGIYYRFNESGTPPTNTNRNIIVDITGADTIQNCIAKTAQALNDDGNFNAIFSSDVLIINCTENGVKPNSYTANTPVVLTNTLGALPNRLNGKWFYINSTNDVDQYYLYFNVSGGGIDPLITGKTGLPVILSSGASAISVANQIKSVLEETGKFVVEQYNDQLFITNTTVGTVSEANANNTNFTIDVRQKGESRKLVAKLTMTYNNDRAIVSVERE